MGYVVEQLAIVNDRDSRPAGYTIVEQTVDTGECATWYGFVYQSYFTLR